MSVTTFKQDLQRGIDVEQKVLSILKKTYPSASLIDKYKGYDIWIPETHKSVEVKYDPMSNTTGNVVIEIWMYEKPSALLTTTADYWVFHDDSIFVSIPPKRIFECIMINELPLRIFTGKGDTVSKKAYLVPKDLLFSYGKIIA
jgi:hypothetical protein